MTDPKKYRLSDEQDALVREIAAASRGVLKEVDVMRLALDALGDYWRHHGNRLLLPLRFHETFSVVTLDPTKPLVLHEPPRARSEPARGAGEHRTRKSGHSPAVRE